MTTDRAPSTDWLAVVLIALCCFGASAQIGKIPPLIEAIRAEMGQGLVALGWLASAVNVTAGLTAMSIGITADRLGRRRLFVAGTLFLLAGGVIARLSDAATPLLIGRLVEGLGYITLFVTAPALISGLARGKELGLALGIWASSLPAGIAAMLVAAPVIAGVGGWRGVFEVGIAIAGLTVILAIVLARRIGPPPKAPPLRLAELRPLLRQPAVWLIAVVFICFTMSWFSLAAWLPLIASEVAGADAVVAGLVTAAVVVGNGVANYIGGILLDRGIPRWRLLVTTSVMMVVLAGLIFLADLPLFLRVVLCVCFTLAGGTQITAIYAAAPVFAPTPRLIGSLNGFFAQSGNLGMALGPPLLAAVAVSQGGDWSASGWLLMALGVVSTVAGVWLRRFEPGRATQP